MPEKRPPILYAIGCAAKWFAIYFLLAILWRPLQRRREGLAALLAVHDKRWANGSVRLLPIRTYADAHFQRHLKLRHATHQAR